jgi:ABC-type bacteriocin/lantibiotic exporter with double-glycine peptidase domain
MASLNDSITPLRRFFALLAPDTRDIVYIYFYAIFNGLLYLSLPLGIQAIINIIMAGQLSTSWVVLVVFVILGVAFTGALQIVQLTITERLQQRIFTKASFEFAFRIPRIKMAAVDKHYVPELMNRFFDTLSVQKGLPKILIDFSSATLQVVFGLFLLSLYHPYFILFGVVLVILVYLIFRLTGKKGLDTSLRESKHKYEVAHWLEEMGRSMGTFKLAGYTNLPLEKTDTLVGKYLKARKQHFRVLVIQFINMVSFKVIVTAGLIILGSFLVIDQQINLGQFVAAEIIILLIMNSVEKLILSMETIYDVITSIEKMGFVTDLPLEDHEGIEEDYLNMNKGLSVSMKNVSYSFADSENPVLKDINLDIKSGERLCISGFSNSGRSTLIRILGGIFLDFKGSVNYNGIPVSNLNVEHLRSYIGDSFHEENIFKGSLLENITLGRPNISIEHVMQVAEKMYMLEFIQGLPGGFNTILEPEGKNLPDSLVSKIILARSIVCNSRLLVVTDHLNKLMPNERKDIMEYLTDKANPWTLIVVSNQSKIAAQCDRVVLMKDGRIINDDIFEAIEERSIFNP